MDSVFILATLATVPFWVLLLVAPSALATVRAVHALWVFAALGALYLVMLAMGQSASADSLLTLDGYQELQADDAAALAGWIHYLSLDLFVGAWLARDADRLGLPRAAVVICLLLTFVLAPLGLTIYLLIRARRAGTTSLFEINPIAAGT